MKNCGITDVNEAKKLVRKGKVTYKQAKNIAKAGNIDSLKYDAKQGVISTTCAMGISFVIDFVICKMNGESNYKALQSSAVDSLKTGGVVFCSSVIISQLSKAGVCKALEVKMEPLVKVLGKNFAERLVKAYGKNVAGNDAMKYAGKILANNVLMSAITIGILEIEDISDIIQGRISKEQFLKNLSVTLAAFIGGGVGSVAGGAAGAAVSAGIGTHIGALLGSLAGAGLAGYVTSEIVSRFIKDDAEKMYVVIEEVFQKLGEDYMITEKEANDIADKLKTNLNEDKLKTMFQSKNREKYAKKMLEPIFEEQAAARAKIEIVSEEETRRSFRDSLQGIVFIH